MVNAPGDPGHLDTVQHALPAQTVGVDRLVGHGQRGVQRIEMAHARVDVRRLDRIAAPHMDRRQHLPQAQELLVVLEIADPPPALEIAGVGRAAHGAEDQPVAAEDERALRVAAMEAEGLRRLADLRLDQIGREADAVAVGRDIGAGLCQERLGLVVQDIDADFLQDRQRRAVDGLELVVGDSGHRIERPARLRPDRGLLDLCAGFGAVAPASAGAAASLGRHWFPFLLRRRACRPYRQSPIGNPRGVARRIRPIRPPGHAESAWLRVDCPPACRLRALRRVATLPHRNRNEEGRR